MTRRAMVAGTAVMAPAAAQALGGKGVIAADMSALRAVRREAMTAVLRGYAADGDGGGGLFYLQDEKAKGPEVPGLYIVSAEGAGWARAWDGVNFNAAWVGCFPDGRDIGGKFGLFPRFATIHFAPGEYQFETYPQPASFSDRFYRGTSVIWNCKGALAPEQAAFTWSFSNNVDFGTDSSGGNKRDMTSAGLSPIEGIGIIGPGQASGTGFRFGTSSRTYFLRPRNFSVGNFHVGVDSAMPMRNVFLTGFSDCTFKSNAINVRLDNTKSFNSGENITLHRCYIGNATIDGIQAVKLQLLVLDNCSLDYNARQAWFKDSNVKMTGGCYLETSDKKTPAEMIRADGVTKLVIDESCNIYALPGNNKDTFAVGDIASIVCHATVFFSGGAGEQILYTGRSRNVLGRVQGGNGSNWVPLLSKHLSLYADPDFSIQGKAGALNLSPGSAPAPRAQIVGDGVRPGRDYAVKLTAPAPHEGAHLALHQFAVEGGQWLFLMHHDKITGTVKNVAHRLQYFTRDGHQIGPDRFVGGGQMPANFTNFPQPFAKTWGSNARDWTLQRAVSMVPQGAAYVMVQLRIDPSSTGAYYISDYHAWQ